LCILTNAGRNFVPRDISLTYKHVKDTGRHVVRSPTKPHPANIMHSLEKEPERGTDIFHTENVEEHVEENKPKEQKPKEQEKPKEETKLQQQEKPKEQEKAKEQEKPKEQKPKEQEKPKEETKPQEKPKEQEKTNLKDGFVHFGGQVKIQHVQTSAYLRSIANARYNDGSFEQVVGCTEATSTDQVFEIVVSKQENHQQGEQLKFGQLFVLKHIATGQLLFCDADHKSPVTAQNEVSCRIDEPNAFSNWTIEGGNGAVPFNNETLMLINVGTKMKLGSGGFTFDAHEGEEMNEVSCTDTGDEWMLITADK
jgi:hypothetical protein